MKVFYAPEQSVQHNQSYSPSAQKPAQLVEQWLERWPDRVEIVKPDPVTTEDFCLAHERRHVEDVMACRKWNGFRNCSAEVAVSLPWTTGSFVSATRHVLAHGGVACSPTSGFHHATYSECQGYCTFNGLMVAAILAAPKVKRVGILDCDYHYGNGTDDIVYKLNLDYVVHATTGAANCTEDPERFLKELPDLIDRRMNVDLLLYQAGADAHIDDPLGGWMTTEQLRRRDRIVFQVCHQNRIPVVWNLAGGYQRDFQAVLDLHHQTMEECLAVYSQAHRPDQSPLQT